MMCWIQKKNKSFRKAIICLFSLLMIQCVEAVDNIAPLFSSSFVLQNQYGVCSHITMLGSRWNYPTHEKELEILKQNNIEWVRSDLEVNKIMPIPDKWTPELFDGVFRNVELNKRKFFPIICSSFRDQYAWEGDWYDKYLPYIANRYAKRFEYWEVMNEVDLILKNNPKRNVAQGYLNTLKKTHTVLKKANPNVKVLSTSFCDMNLTLLDYLCQNKGYQYFDILNMHSYVAPEVLPANFSAVKARMNKYGWHSPVWMTECGFSTVDTKEEMTNKGFFTDFLPAAMRNIGMDLSHTDLAVLADAKVQYTAVSADEVELYLRNRCKSIRYVSFAEIKGLSVSSYPVLMVSEDESFPIAYFNLIVDYVKRGGTIVLAGGSPFYFDMRNITLSGFEKHQVGDTYYRQLHMSSLFWWTPKAKQVNATEVPTVSKNHVSNYTWKFSSKYSSRYLSSDNLKPGDRLIPMIEAGDGNFKGCVAGVYQLNSDLKGNIIFQTRLGAVVPTTEAEQARRVPRIHLISFANGVDKVFMYNLRSSELDQYDKESHFGLLHSDLSEKPAFQTYKTLIDMCPSGSTRPKLSFKDGVYVAEWKKSDGKYVICLWTSVSSKNVRLKSSQNIQMVDFKGKRIKSKDNVIHISPEVVYLVSKSPLNYVTNFSQK